MPALTLDAAEKLCRALGLRLARGEGAEAPGRKTRAKGKAD
jgi:hypothetical protein